MPGDERAERVGCGFFTAAAGHMRDPSDTHADLRVVPRQWPRTTLEG
jgi:hypothetical protein